MSGHDSFDGLLEGSPYMVRRFRIHVIKDWIKSPGRCFFGLEELEQEVASMERNHEIWPSRYNWQATVATDWDWSSKSRRLLTVMWYQEDENPFDRLQEILVRTDISEQHTVELYKD
jgi:hypothetical protein